MDCSTAPLLPRTDHDFTRRFPPLGFPTGVEAAGDNNVPFIDGQRSVVRREEMDLSVVCERAPLDVQVACGILALRDQHETALSWLAGKHGINALWSYCANQVESELARVERADDQEAREWLEVILAPQRVANFRRNGLVGCVMPSSLAKRYRNQVGQCTQ